MLAYVSCMSMAGEVVVFNYGHSAVFHEKKKKKKGNGNFHFIVTLTLDKQQQ